jgi:hypothetical protein
LDYIDQWNWHFIKVTNAIHHNDCGFAYPITPFCVAFYVKEMKTRAKSVTRKQRNVNSKRSKKAIVKIECVIGCIPNEDSVGKQKDSIGEDPILQLDEATIVKQADFFNEKLLSLKTTATEQSNQSKSFSYSL